jgi:glycosyltransferase involved in cell wall biosynthesis
MKKIAALVPNKLGKSPGQRFRIEAWSKHLPEYGWTVDFYPFETDELDKVLYTKGNYLKKVSGLISSYRGQLRNVLNKPECDILLIYREAALVGPAVIERLARRLKVPIVYDIDDPVFLPYRSPVNSWFSLLKFSRKTHSFFRMADHIISINNLMADYARKYNSSISVVPNFVDTNEFCPAVSKNGGPAKIVWTGSIGTVRNLATIAKPLHDLQAKYDVPLRLIANEEPVVEGVKVDFRKWSPDVEISNLQDCDIGLVPLLDLRWNPWKFFLKTVQYMAAGLPVVARRMGSNTEIIQDGVNGFLVETEKEWFDRLSLLIEDRELREKMGRAARKTAVEGYSLETQMPKIAEIFDGVYEGTLRNIKR